MSTGNSYVKNPLQGGDGQNPTRLWTHEPGGSVIVADFSASKHLRHEVQVANARRARAAWNLCSGLSTEEIETMLKGGRTIASLEAEVRGLRMFKASVDEALNSGDGTYKP